MGEPVHRECTAGGRCGVDEDLRRRMWRWQCRERAPGAAAGHQGAGVRWGAGWGGGGGRSGGHPPAAAPPVPARRLRSPPPAAGARWGGSPGGGSAAARPACLQARRSRQQFPGECARRQTRPGRRRSDNGSCQAAAVVCWSWDAAPNQAKARPAGMRWRARAYQRQPASAPAAPPTRHGGQPLELRSVGGRRRRAAAVPKDGRLAPVSVEQRLVGRTLLAPVLLHHRGELAVQAEVAHGPAARG
jgi:hypothetical protein